MTNRGTLLERIEAHIAACERDGCDQPTIAYEAGYEAGHGVVELNIDDLDVNGLVDIVFSRAMLPIQHESRFIHGFETAQEIAMDSRTLDIE